ncbi:MFS transporter [Pelagimonas varians]|uniref:Major Facilitator Superfamily protein n=1 Tax=Pelagimonas varians TaxID=696760 RepID=A0A238KEI9_9RHOB|nr:MFS transporter [Pelagimonas varians]PYG29875.1 putative MFS family arabinose efflux permease [Pelagimonas varians]SMX40904.1 Major Facilitator Superfamily protein [Pelagimonas varians]
MTQVDDTRARRNVTVLVLAQAILGAQMPMIFTIGGLAGLQLAPNPCFATLPISLIVLGSMLAATPVSSFMQSHGRKAGFLLGAFMGALGAAIAAFGLYQANFAIFLMGSLVTGVYMSAQGFYRFAAADTASDEFRPKAISYVMAGGLLAAVIGPQLGNFSSLAFGPIPFFGTYLMVAILNTVGAGLFFFLDIPKPPAPTADSPKGRTRMEMLRTPRIAVAIIAAMVSYALMNLVMTSTPLAVVGCGLSGDTEVPDYISNLVPAGTLREQFQFIAGYVVTAHVLAMFAPSFFTGHLIAKFGVEKVIAAGLVILGAAGLVALQGVELENFFIALVLLGIGWNFGFIGATAMLAGSHAPEERGRLQGMNDLIVFGGVTFASLSSGGLMNCSGGSAQQGWAAVNIAMVPFLALAGAALIWLVLRPKDLNEA